MRVIGLLLSRALIPRRDNILSYALWISTAGVALGVTLVFLVLAVMTGFQKMLKQNYTRISSEMVVLPAKEQRFDPSFRANLLAVDGVEKVTPFMFGQAMLLKPGSGSLARGGVTLEGIDFESSKAVTPWAEVWQQGPLWEVQKENPRWIWLGVQLAKKLGVNIGEKVNVLIAKDGGRKIIPFVVTAITKFGIYEHDLRYTIIDIRTLAELFGRKYPSVEPMYKCLMVEGTDLEIARLDIMRMLGGLVSVKLWSEINRNIFMAVEHQKGTLFLMLQIIIALAGVNVMNLLVMTSNNRRRDVAILRAMGLRFSSVFTYFVAQGTIVGVLGVGLGIGMGYLVSELATYYQPIVLNEEIYNATTLPFEVQLSDILTMAISALFLCSVFSVIPALKAAWERPVSTLRYE